MQTEEASLKLRDVVAPWAERLGAAMTPLKGMVSSHLAISHRPVSGLVCAELGQYSRAVHHL